MSLFTQAVRRRYLPAGEASELRWFAAAEMSLRAGTSPPALFVSTTKGERWERITDLDEQRAADRLRVYYGLPKVRRGRSPEAEDYLE